MRKTAKYRFNEFELCSESEQLFYQGNRIKLEPQLFTFLMLLLDHRGELLGRHQIQESVWAGRPVTDEAIRAAIKKLRDLLDDDARAPRFIKTIPKQGYKWLAPVTTHSRLAAGTHSPTALQSAGLGGARGWLLLLVVGLIVAVVMFKAIQPVTGLVSTQPQQIQLTPLTSLEGSEVFADFHKADNKLVFLHRDAADSPQQLYTKHLDSGEVQRLSWDHANYTNSYWSPDGKSLAFNRSAGGQQSLYIAKLDEQSKIIDVERIDHPGLHRKFVIGWLKDQTGLLLAEEMSAAKQHSIYQLNLAQKALEALSFPNVAGRGDYLAAQSHDGTKLAILREVSKQQVSLVVMEWQSGRILANRSLPFTATRLAWHQDNQTVILSSFYGHTSRYRIQEGVFDAHPKLVVNSLDVYASCGTHCYILRRHNGNFLDIQEAPLELYADKNETTMEGPVLQSGRMLKQPDAQDLPRYTGKDEQLIFVSLIGQTLVIQHLDEMHRLQELGRLDPGLQLSTLSVSDDGSRIAGVAEGRLFLLDTDSDATSHLAPQYLTHGLERVDNPMWHPDNRQLYLAHFAGNTPSIVLFDTQNQTRQTIISGMLSFRPIPDDPSMAVGIDVHHMAWRLASVDGIWEKDRPLIQLDSANHHRWQLLDNLLYFSRYQGRESQLCALAIEFEVPLQSPHCRSTGTSRFRLNFDIHPTAKTVLMVESLSAQSDIVRMTW